MTTKIPFNVPLVLGSETAYVNDAINRKEFSGGGHYTKLCQSKLEEITGTKAALLTSSCTHALEMCAILLNIKEGDEVIMASYNFVSAANAFVLRGAKIVFVDIRKDTLNIDEELIEEAITDKTKAIVAMHYGGVACNMTKIMLLAEKHNLFVVEDAAHCIGAYSGQKHLGTMGHLGTLSFHSTKNIHCGEGGALLINDERFIERAQIIRDKGTNRQHFIEGKVQKYTWVDIGSSYLLGELSAAFLYAQTLSIQEVIMERTILLNKYQAYISQCSLFDKPLFGGNGHIFYLICQSSQIRNQIMEKLDSYGISAHFHYVPLHLSSAGKKYSCTHTSLKNTVDTSDRLLRLPLYLGISPTQQQYVAEMLDIINK